MHACIDLYSDGQLPHREDSQPCKKALFGIFPNAEVVEIEGHKTGKHAWVSFISCT